MNTFLRVIVFCLLSLTTMLHGLTLDDLGKDFTETWTMLQYVMQALPQHISQPTTITSSGRYKLINNIEGQIIIAADEVELDLSNYTIMGGTDTLRIDQQAGITVRRGVLAGGTQSCAKVTNAQSIFFDSIGFVGSYTGLFIQTATGCSINNCTFDGQLSSMSVLDDVHRAVIQHSHYRFEGGDAGFADLEDIITLMDSSNIMLDDVDIANNSAATSDIVPIINVQNVYGSIIKNCIITGNSLPYFVAILFQDCSDAWCYGNIIASNTDINSDLALVQLTDSINIVIDSCIINRNISLDSPSYGIRVTNNIDSIIKGCNILSNFSETSTAIGIWIEADSDSTSVRNNLLKRNNGPILGVGIQNDNDSSMIVHNEAQGHSTANYAGTIFQVSTYSSHLGKFIGVADPLSSFDNISIIS